MVSWSFFRVGVDAGWEGWHPVWGSPPLFVYSVVFAQFWGLYQLLFFTFVTKIHNKQLTKGRLYCGSRQGKCSSGSVRHFAGITRKERGVCWNSIGFLPSMPSRPWPMEWCLPTSINPI